MRTFVEMSNEALTQRWRCLCEKKDPSEAEFPATREELRQMRKQPWQPDRIDSVHNERIYGLRCVLREE
jgi:hypothetical protein